VRTAWGRDFRIGLTDLVATPRSRARDLNVESIFEYGSRVGFWEIMRIFQSRKVEATIFAVGMALERTPQIAEAMAQSGFEVACHGQRWIDYQSVPEDEERAHMRRNIEVITRLIGRRPLGWYTGRPGQTRAGSWSRAAAFCMTATLTTMICPFGPGWPAALTGCAV